MDLSNKWTDYTFIAFDLETSGAYPMGDEICEIAAVKYKDGQIIDQFHSLVRPQKTMSEFIIGIHGITNEMVATAPRIESLISGFHQFIQGCILVAHHAPFDLGFLSWEFEKAKLPLPQEPVLCSSLFARAVIQGSENHRLQTLIQHLGLTQGEAHRALDDAKACLELTIKCIERVGGEQSLQRVFEAAGGPLYWNRFALLTMGQDRLVYSVKKAIENESSLDIIYEGGQKKGKLRKVRPYGIVRSLNGDYLSAWCDQDRIKKRFFINKIKLP